MCLFPLFSSGLPQFPRWGWCVPAALVEMQRALSKPQALFGLREEGHEPGSICSGSLVGGPHEDVRRDLHQGQGAWRIRQKRQEGWEDRREEGLREEGLRKWKAFKYNYRWWACSSVVCPAVIAMNPLSWVNVTTTRFRESFQSIV